MRLPELVIQQHALHYLPLPLKTNCTKTSSALTGPISSVVPAATAAPTKYGPKVNMTEESSNDGQDHSREEGRNLIWPTFSEGPSTIYKDFGNGLSFCNTNLPSDSCACPYDFSMNGADLDRDIVSEDILMEFLQGLESTENRTLSELDIEMVDLGDLSDFLDHLAEE